MKSNDAVLQRFMVGGDLLKAFSDGAIETVFVPCCNLWNIVQSIAKRFFQSTILPGTWGFRQVTNKVVVSSKCRIIRFVCHQKTLIIGHIRCLGTVYDNIPQ